MSGSFVHSESVRHYRLFGVEEAAMFSVAAFALQVMYSACVLGLAIYGVQAIWLTGLLTRRKPSADSVSSDCASSGIKAADLSVEQWPVVTVQLPIYNERHVVERLVEACARLHYPPEKLQIQILDDSDDQTAALTETLGLYWREQGRDVSVVRRPNREGYKAGALAHALATARGEFVAIFDADFVPDSDFLLRTVPHFFRAGNERIGFIQTRWGHLNRNYSALTRCQALALDGHFVVEQGGRQAGGLPFAFNGSGGIWRRACIEDPAVGGWQTDTLCEDLDLSYRGLLAGWQPLYLDDVEAPAEIPVQLQAFKRQQFRWAKGSVQTLRKLGGRILRSDWSVLRRAAAICHLSGYLIHPLLLLMLLIVLPLTLLGQDPAAPLAYLSIASVGPPILYLVAQRRLHPTNWLRHWAILPMLMLLGTGLCYNNTRAVREAFSRQGGAFLRTPKFHVLSDGDDWHGSAYGLGLERSVLGEVLCLLYACGTVVASIFARNWWAIPFLMIYVMGFALTAGTGLWQAWSIRHARKKRRGRRYALPAESPR
jgi:cellulose synthase/poly-beta-1,6-N-acetylglucosamine synthase-like glycosyltransferase